MQSEKYVTVREQAGDTVMIHIIDLQVRRDKRAGAQETEGLAIVLGHLRLCELSDPVLLIGAGGECDGSIHKHNHGEMLFTAEGIASARSP